MGKITKIGIESAYLRQNRWELPQQVLKILKILIFWISLQTLIPLPRSCASAQHFGNSYLHTFIPAYLICQQRMPELRNFNSAESKYCSIFTQVRKEKKGKIVNGRYRLIEVNFESPFKWSNEQSEGNIKCARHYCTVMRLGTRWQNQTFNEGRKETVCYAEGTWGTVPKMYVHNIYGIGLRVPIDSTMGVSNFIV